ncbi:MAG TPA: hypothetical protein PKU97_16735, partial [Kofleriaceae bacterium]|nr:hypothetical protein [Kofleriaceae bacterium]
MKLHRFAPLWVAALVFAAYATLSRGSMGAGSRLVDALALWLPLGDAALRSRLALALVAAITAWAVAKIVSSSAMPASSGTAVTSDGAVGAIAGVVSAVLLVGAPTYWLAGAAGAVAVGAALVAISGCRRVASAGAEVPAREALGAALAVVVAAALEPGYGALAGPALLLWWSSVGRRRGDLRGRREVRVAALGVTPALLLAAAALWLRGVLASSAVAAAGAAAGPGSASS